MRWADSLYCIGRLAAVAALLTACVPSPDPTVSAVATEPDATSAPAPPKPVVRLVRGYFEKRDGGLFTACGETSRRHVRAEQATSRAVDAMAEAGDEPRFLVASGNLVGADAVEIFALDLIATDAFDCESPLEGYILSARGTEALWTLEITSAAITFTPAPGATAEIFPHRPFKYSKDLTVVEANNAQGPIRIELRAELCTEKMTGTTFGLAATVEALGQSFSGCAWRGLADG
jgi:uncharacterized membrane protein